jgi:group I intron endonuclease
MIKVNNYKHYIVYETINKINGKKYVGCHATNDIDDGYIGSGNLLKEAIKKYGIENFERRILHHACTPEEMFNVESSIVTEEFVARDDTYNLVPGGFGGFKVQDVDDWKNKLRSSRKGKKPALGLKHTEESKRKMSVSKKGRPAWNKGLPGTFRGKNHTEEAKRKNSEAHKGLFSGSKNPMYGKSAVKGRKWYNDGTRTFYLYPDDTKVKNLKLGRLFPNRA